VKTHKLFPTQGGSPGRRGASPHVGTIWGVVWKLPRTRRTDHGRRPRSRRHDPRGLCDRSLGTNIAELDLGIQSIVEPSRGAESCGRVADSVVIHSGLIYAFDGV